MSGMTPAEMLYQMEHSSDDRSSDVIGAAVTMAVLATAAVTLRFMCRKHMSVPFSHDDHLMLGALIFALGLCFILGYGTTAAIFICTPISYFWTRSGTGHCINEMLMFYISAALTVVADVLILLLPMPIIWRLQMHRSKKIGVMAIFLLGGFTCVATIVRMVYIRQIVVIDPTWTQVDPGIWSAIEPCMGIVSACLPVIGPLLRTKLGSMVGSPSWLSRPKRSGQDASYVAGSSARRGNDSSRSMQKKPTATATAYPRDVSYSDAEMAVPLREIEGRI
ncbi:MAG: hypothetical protein Q9207_002522 [Kuettlingeria erythrocarpa]